MIESLIVAGVDEVGRGALIGDVVSCALILPKNYPTQALKDSKKLSPKKRTHIAEQLKQHCCYAIGRASPKEIDQLNIHHATLLSMKRAVQALSISPDELWVDGKYPPNTTITTQTFIQGDGLHACISAASIVAKTTRDQDMFDLDKRYPFLHLKQHKGYPTKLHLEALSQYGPTPYHRYSFKPVIASRKPSLHL